jgi:tetratricopeptide (TPR) repeat protein/predicted Ser/Thr protein kinase
MKRADARRDMMFFHVEPDAEADKVCLSDSVILRLVEQTVSTDEVARAERHIAGCSDCRRLVSAAAGGRASAVTGGPDPSAPSASEPRGERAMDPASILSRGALLGRYVVIDPVGEGGMGVVYAAFDPELDRRVAIKLWRRAASRDEAQARLAREAKAMARLSHPNVVAVHDDGVVDGRIFLAMELVEGSNLQRWLRDKERTASEKIAVLRDAGRGLAAAHGAGLVHRDFKPDNVLVRRDGSACVTDFGLARSAWEAADPATAEPAPRSPPEALPSLTQTGTLAGTPAYMAPEQLADPGSANAASDQYAFCVTAFEVLFGKRPFAGDTLAALTEAKRAGLLSGVPAAADVPSRVRKAIARGLSADPKLRFGSMNELLAELGEARPSRWPWLAVAAAALAVGGTLLATRATRPAPPTMCTGGEQKLAGIWDAERSHAVEAAFGAVPMPFAPDAWKGVKKTLDAEAKAWTLAYTDACEATRVRGEQSDQVLDRRMQCLHERLSETKALVDVFAHADATVVRRAIPAVEAIPPPSVCSAGRVLSLLPAAPATPEARALADEIEPDLAKARAAQWVGDFDGAAKIGAAALERARTGTDRELLAKALFRFADAKSRTSAVADGVQAMYEAAWTAEAIHDDDTAARAWSELSHSVGLTQGHYAEGELILHQAEAAVERAGNGPELLCGLQGGTLLWKEGKLVEALAREKRTADACAQAFGPDHFSNAATLGNIGSEEAKLGHYDDSLADQQRAADLIERELGPSHPTLSLALDNVASTLEEVGRFAEAVPLARRAMEITERSVGREHPNMGTNAIVLARALRELGDYGEARALLDQALALDERLIPDSLNVGTVLQDRAGVAISQERWKDAEQDLRRAIAIEEHVDANHYDLVPASMALARVERATGRAPLALRDNRRALDVAKKALGTDHPTYGSALVALGEGLLAVNDVSEARQRLTEGIAVLQAHGQQPKELEEARALLARASK